MSYQSQNELRVTSNHFFVLLWQVDHSFVLMRGNDLVQTKRESLRSLDIFHSLSKRHRTGSRRLGFSVLFQSYEYVEHHHLEGGKGILMKKGQCSDHNFGDFFQLFGRQINHFAILYILKGKVSNTILRIFSFDYDLPSCKGFANSARPWEVVFKHDRSSQDFQQSYPTALFCNLSWHAFLQVDIRSRFVI